MSYRPIGYWDILRGIPIIETPQLVVMTAVDEPIRRPRVGPLGTDQYRCYECGEIYNKGWTDVEALAELEQGFNVPVEECEIVCDDCFKSLGYKYLSEEKQVKEK